MASMIRQKLLGVRLAPQEHNDGVAALLVQSNTGSTTYEVTRSDLEELARVLQDLAGQISDGADGCGDSPAVPDTFYFNDSVNQQPDGDGGLSAGPMAVTAGAETF